MEKVEVTAVKSHRLNFVYYNQPVNLYSPLTSQILITYTHINYTNTY